MRVRTHVRVYVVCTLYAALSYPQVSDQLITTERPRNAP